MRYKVFFQDGAVRTVQANCSLAAVKEAQKLQLSFPNCCLVLSHVEELPEQLELEDLEISSYKISSTVSIQMIENPNKVWVIINSTDLILNRNNEWQTLYKTNYNSLEFDSPEEALIYWNKTCLKF